MIYIYGQLHNAGIHDMYVSYLGPATSSVLKDQNDKLMDSFGGAYVLEGGPYGNETLHPNITTTLRVWDFPRNIVGGGPWSLQAQPAELVSDVPGNYHVRSVTTFNYHASITSESNNNAITLWSKPLQITILPKKSTDDESYQSDVVTVGPKILSPAIQNMFTCYNPHMDMEPSSVYTINNQGLQFILDNNPDLQNRISSFNQSEILDKFFYTVEKKLISDSEEFKSLHGNKDSIVFGSQSAVGVGGYLSCGQVGIVGSFQTDSLEKYKIIFQMKDDSTYAFVLYPYQGDPTSSKIPIKYLMITEVELSSKNGTQWVRVYNPTSYEIPLDYVNIVDSKSGLVFADSEKNSTLKPGQNIVLPVIHPTTISSDLVSLNNSITIYPVYGLMYSPPSNMPNMYWDMTPVLTDSSHDSKTWQYNGTEWVYTDKRVVIPEFPLAQIILVFSIASVIVFYRIRFRK